MRAEEAIRTRRAAILARWSDLILEAYPGDAGRFLRTESDRFRNPVGYAVAASVGPLLDDVLEGKDPDRSKPALDALIRIRAVQDMTAARAVGFVFLLKQAVQEEVAGSLSSPGEWRELVGMYHRIDRLALVAFEVYAKCREQVRDIRADAIERRSAKLLEFVEHRYGSVDDALGIPDRGRTNGGGSGA